VSPASVALVTTPSAGDHSVKAPLNIGVADAGLNAPPSLDISDPAVFTLRCVSGPLVGQSFVVTDPGRALISGKCADIGKLKGPVPRDLATRAP
jgi:cytochrome c peroxidase